MQQTEARSHRLFGGWAGGRSQRGFRWFGAVLALGLLCEQWPCWAGEPLPVEAPRLSTPPATTAEPSRLEPLTATSTSGLKVILRVEGRPQGSTWRSLESGATLRSGDSVRLKVQLSAPAYVYVAQFFGDQTAVVLYPASMQAPSRVPGGAFVTLPQPGSIFELDQHPGDEHVYVIASLRPLQEVDAGLVGVLEKVRLSGLDGPAPAAQPVEEDGQGGGGTSEPKADPAGTAPVPSPPLAPGKSRPPSAAAQPAPGRPMRPPNKRPILAEKRPAPEALVAMNTATQVFRAELEQGTRGLKLASDPETPEATLIYQADREGVAVLHVWLKHER